MPGINYKRRFVYVAGPSRKFWEVEVNGNVMLSRWGRLGTAGQMLSTPYASFADALAIAESKCKEKLYKGYTEETLYNKPANVERRKQIVDEALRNFKNDKIKVPKAPKRRRGKGGKFVGKADTLAKAPIKVETPDVYISPELMKPKRKVVI